MINLLGPPPPSLLAQGMLRDKFFTEDGRSSRHELAGFRTLFSNSYGFPGTFRNKDLLTDQVPLEQRETTLEGKEEREAFLRLMRKMLQWEPGKRSSAKELAEDEWIWKHRRKH